MMQFKIGLATLELIRGNIVEQDVDAIVNAANETLAPGGGVSGAIHRAAGPELAEACARIGGCPTGEARITAGYHLKARHVIHAVGPRYSGNPRDAELLASAYRSSLLLAEQHGLQHIAFPSISTGIYGYPLDEAAPIALATCRDVVQSHSEIRLVRFVLFDEETFQAYVRAAQNLGLIPVD
ncbi:O-acetyl-ADP-ribose deacetylase [Roseiflexus castenholzii]|jgi:O-acetyl-ADP-ribose deacetylase (regulator of RNase III)|uniref:Appr-1-p processing domain protein n=1 Tax=Roseiflexus castenholzii (strain DSM 13941 / HLO8) TaxID=383372 RepID=A7NGG9_ROSCS|nr:O-acetyl-ADP-ribose deacetylase [Roseiflexus castenholzii]ABU56556.1 Appr-1-p processing domain protein [Roseiflexus castenholzii DSM 13941]